MKMNKIFGACALLLALAVVGCNSNPSSEAPASSPAPASQPASVAPSSAAPSSAAPSSEVSSTPASLFDEALLTPLVRNYTDGTPATNSANKEYIPLTDATANKVGVKISIQNWEAAEGAADGSALDTDGGLLPKNNHNGFIAYKIKAPKAGNYQMVMTGKCSSGQGENKTLDERAFAVKLNGEEVDVHGDRNPVTTTAAPFVAAPIVALRGPEQEDVIAVSCSDYRIKFDTASFVLFQEI